MYKIFGILILLHLVSAEESYKTHRLPGGVIPESYKIDLETDLDENSDNAFAFNGNVTIKLKVLYAVNNITLHSRDLTINPNDVQVYKNEEEIENFTLEFNNDLEFMRIITNSLFEDGNYALKISYSGKLRDETSGFLKESYMNDKGEKVLV